MQKRFFLPILLCVILGILPSLAFAQISVNNVIAHFKYGQRPVQNVTVGNAADTVTYVTVNVKVAPDPSKDRGNLVETNDLLVSPKNFSVEPNGQRTVRLLLKTPVTDKEQLFEVSFVPQDRGFGKEVVQEIEGRRTMLRVLTGMGMLVFVDPKDPKADLKWERNSSSITFFNKGNIHIYLGDGRSCANKDETDCPILPSTRLFAGQQFEVKVPGDRVVTYLINEGASGEYKKITIDPVG